jgi:hypothetical protein
MGFTPRSTVYVLEFEGTDYEGLVVRMRASKLGALFEGSDLAAASQRLATSVTTNAVPAPEDVDMMTGQFVTLADHLVSWNIEDDDKAPVPATLDGLKTLEIPLIRRIAQAWQSAMGDVAPPLSNSSSSGLPPDVLHMPMEPLAGSLAS